MIRIELTTSLHCEGSAQTEFGLDRITNDSLRNPEECWGQVGVTAASWLAGMAEKSADLGGRLKPEFQRHILALRVPEIVHAHIGISAALRTESKVIEDDPIPSLFAPSGQYQRFPRIWYCFSSSRTSARQVEQDCLRAFPVVLCSSSTILSAFDRRAFEAEDLATAHPESRRMRMAPTGGGRGSQTGFSSPQPTPLSRRLESRQTAPTLPL